MPVTEVQKLRVRLQQLGTTTPTQQNNQINPGNLNNQNNQNITDTSIKEYNNQVDTTPHRPIINPRIFGSELFNNTNAKFSADNTGGNTIKLYNRSGRSVKYKCIRCAGNNNTNYCFT